MSRRFALAAAVLASACTMQHVQSSQSVQSVAVDDHMAHMSAADMRAPMTVRGSPDQQGHAGLPASDKTAAARIAASPRHAEWVKIAWEPGSSDSLMAWIVYPTARNKAPVVVVVHEIFGLSTWVRGVADQVAADGFIAIAPDFISRVRPGGPSTTELTGDAARGMIGQVDIMSRITAINAAASFAMMQPSAEQKFGVIGYCWGGGTVFNYAINGGVKGFSGGVAFYGAPPTGGGQRATAGTPAVPASIIVDSIAKIKVPTMLLSGTGDARITAVMPQLDSLMKKLGKTYSGVNYEGATHGFLREQEDSPMSAANAPAGPANLAATKDAWPKTIAFLKKNLGVK